VLCCKCTLSKAHTHARTLHTHSPGRLVHSITLLAPTDPSATITVGATTKTWEEGTFLSFDDSFHHSVDNPHPSAARIVLAFVALHPDLASDAEKGVVSDAEKVLDADTGEL
jgi:hypothetical protein